MKNILLTLITENQAQKITAEKFCDVIKNELGEGWEIVNINKYYKFENSFKIEFKSSYIENQQNEINNLAISLMDKLVSPWLVYFDKDENNIELVYNKEENTRKRKLEFNVIKWGHLQITK